MNVDNNIYLVYLNVCFVQQCGLGEYRAVRVDADNDALGAALFDLVSHTGDGTAGSRAYHHHVHLIV